MDVIHGCDSMVDLAQEVDMLDLAIMQQFSMAEQHHFNMS